MIRLVSAIRGWPATIRVPVFVAILMVVVSAAVSERVLTRLAETQSRHLQELGDAYVDGLSSTVIPAVLRADVWETFDKLDRAAGLYRGLSLIQTVVTDARGTVVASSDPRVLASGSEPPTEFLHRFSQADGLRTDADAARAYLRRDLVHQDRKIGRIYAVLDIAHLSHERREVLTTLVLTNTAITIFLVFVGYWAVTRMVHPLRVLADHLRHGAGGRIEPIPHEAIRENGEAGQLFRAYNGLVDAFTEREALTRRLAKEEKLASLGRLASGMAHEINNPLGGLFNTLDTLKHHGKSPAVRNASISLLERGLLGIRDVVRAALVSYRSEGETRPLRPADLDDIRLLVGPELRRHSLTLKWKQEIGSEVAVSATALRQAVLNLVLNACAASPPGSVVAFAASMRGERLIITVDDSGAGMPDEARVYLTTPVARDVSFPTGPCLGLWLVRRLACELGATIKVGHSEVGGARITLEIPVAENEALSDVA